MCLSEIIKRADDMPAEAIGKKILRKTPDNRYKPLYYTEGIPGTSIGQGWAMPDDAEPLWIDRENAYLPGVHAYQDGVALKLAGERVVRVRLRGPIAEGFEGNLRVLVYREMTLLEESSPAQQEVRDRDHDFLSVDPDAECVNCGVPMRDAGMICPGS